MITEKWIEISPRLNKHCSRLDTIGQHYSLLNRTGKNDVKEDGELIGKKDRILRSALKKWKTFVGVSFQCDSIDCLILLNI